MDARKIRLMRELQWEYYGELKRSKSKRKKEREAKVFGLICCVVLGFLAGALLL